MLTFIKFLLIHNPWKSILFFLSISLLTTILILNNYKTPIQNIDKYPVAFHNDQIVLIYTGETNQQNGLRGWSLKERYTSDVIRDGYLIEVENDFRFSTTIMILLIILLASTSIFIILLITEFTGGEDGGVFNLERVYIEYYYTKIKYVEENGKYYFYLYDRLLGVNNKLEYNLYKEIEKYYKNKNLLPLWEGTTQEKRDKKLTQILK